MKRFLQAFMSAVGKAGPTATPSPGPKGQPPKGAIEEARKKPNGWVYEIAGSYGPDDAVPPEAIRGAWKVDEHGNIVGDFLPNPNFVAPTKSPKDIPKTA